MKRFLAVFLTALCLTIPLAAHAGQWIDREIKWFLSGDLQAKNGVAGSGLFVRDTVFNVVGGLATTSGRLDTTGTFNLNKAYPFYFGNASTQATGRDSMLAGFLVLQVDSSTAVTGTLSSAAGILEGKFGETSWPGASVAGWQPIDSLTTLCASGDVAVPIPIPVKAQKITTTSANSVFLYPNLRFRFTTTMVGALQSARVFIRYWNP